MEWLNLSPDIKLGLVVISFGVALLLLVWSTTLFMDSENYLSLLICWFKILGCWFNVGSLFNLISLKNKEHNQLN